VLLALGLIATVITDVQQRSVDPLGVVVMLLSAASVVLLWTPQSRAYFAAASTARPPKPVKPYLDPGNR
jgi:hypothetical protein